MVLIPYLGGVVGAPYDGYPIPAINSSYLGDVAVNDLTCNADFVCSNETIPANNCNYVYISCVRGKCFVLTLCLLYCI